MVKTLLSTLLELKPEPYMWKNTNTRQLSKKQCPKRKTWWCHHHTVGMIFFILGQESYSKLMGKKTEVNSGEIIILIINIKNIFRRVYIQHFTTNPLLLICTLPLTNLTLIKSIGLAKSDLLNVLILRS